MAEKSAFRRAGFQPRVSDAHQGSNLGPAD